MNRSVSTHRLSKSRFLAGLQCAKRLYLEIHSPELATPPTPDRRAIMDMGTDVGVVARQCFPHGVLVEQTHRQIPAALLRTSELVKDEAIPSLFEGAFVWEGILIRVDILERIDATRWRLIEVKATSKVKATHLDDLAIQAAVLEGAGIEVSGCFLMHLNTQYSFLGGDLNLEEMFVLENKTEEVEARRPLIQAQLEDMWMTLEQATPPPIAPDSHCHQPYECPFGTIVQKRSLSVGCFIFLAARNCNPSSWRRGLKPLMRFPIIFSCLQLSNE